MVAAVLSLLAAMPAQGQGVPPASSAPVSSVAQQVYAAARGQLLQVRTLVTAAGRQSSIGSGFVVDAEGLAITNYHVISQHARDPDSYRLEYATADGGSGRLDLLAIDIANDLAVVRLDRGGAPAMLFDERARRDDLPKGERLYSMGNPLDLGFAIVEGTFNGFVDRSYNERVLFTGAINPGMSGGPAVTADGRVAGVNVAKRRDGELVSFLVPARFATALLARARAGAAATDFRAELGRQVIAWQDGFYEALTGSGLRQRALGPYDAPESAAAWFNCWARTNAGQVPKPRATLDMATCSGDAQLFVTDGLLIGRVEISHSHARSVDLNAFQFATFLSQQAAPNWFRGWSAKWYTPQRCHTDFVAAPDASTQPPLQVTWCARGYREFDGLYDVSVVAVTQDRAREALVSRLVMQGVSHENAVALMTRVIEAVKWTK